MITRKMRRQNKDLYWNTMIKILVDICGYTQNEALQHTKNVRRLSEAQFDTPAKRERWVYSLSCEYRASLFAIGPCKDNPVGAWEFDDLRREWIDRVRPEIDAVELELWGKDRLAVREVWQ